MRIYTDGSTKTISGIAFIVTNEKHKVLYRDMKATETNDNNIAELQAIDFALQSTQEMASKSLTIFTDSAYAIKRIYQAKHLRPEEIDLVMRIRQQLAIRNGKMFWIKGHCQDGTVLSHFNHQVDALSKVARKNRELELERAKPKSRFLKKWRER